MRNPERNGLQALILSEQTFPIIEQITAGMPGGFFIYHADGNEELIYANQALIQIFGCESLEEFQELTGYVFPGLVHPEDLEAAERSIHQQIFTHGNDLDYIEYRIIRKDGSVRWLEDYGHFVHTDFYGDIFYVFVEDATEKKRKAMDDARTARLAQERLEALEALEHETTALRLVHEILRSGMWTMEFDQQGQMISVFWSQEFRAMIGYQDDQDFPNVLSSWSDLLHPEDRQRVLEQYYATINDYTGNSLYDVEYRLLTKDRGYRWFRATGKLSRREDGSPITYVGMFVDITHRKETDQKLLEQRKLLEEALMKSQRASQAKTTFLNNMSHDIRTPMNAIIGFTNLALTHLDNQELVRDYLTKIAASSSHLLSLINDVLDMSRIESGKVVIKEAPCSLSLLLQNLQSMIQADLKVKGLHFCLDDGLIHPYVICDQLRLNQVLLNVLSNALKFTPADGSILFSAVERPGDKPDIAVYEFRIQDTGIGMAPEFLDRIFEPFERERTSTVSGIPGTGLGMSITRNLTELMNGRIAVESQKGHGSTFTFTFSFRLSQAPEEQKQADVPAAARCLSGRRLLLAEDNELNQEIAVAILEDAGCIVEVASNGAEAVEKVLHSSDAPYDLILMDIQMPVMDGIEAAKTIRALDDPHLASLPIVAMTANAFEEDRQLVLSAAMNAHLGKPIDVNKLFSTLQNILNDT